ncbi:hypothetical protein Nlim_0391 [Candidatus Nitrosarchaeum limnium SFB1]|jgi:hypothetical protein|uniref:DUF2299 domain-containing protein n=1 Tax=Candidatus Nitrosarchaeum limnium SFB1 TaxID=886738 RepID=F3KIW7_9ARCH|nr:hypothetical protein Nlim_0391 [Candidatus Nitrosarchaeum limnium SFB1]
MSTSRMRDNVERWLIHEGLSFQEMKNPENTFQILVKHAGKYGIPTEIFEPKSQPGVIVIGAKVILKDNQIARFLGFTEDEKEKFERRVAEYCNSIQAINRIVTEDGKQKVGVFVVLDDKENIHQQTVLDAINKASELHEKTSRFLMKTF